MTADSPRNQYKRLLRDAGRELRRHGFEGRGSTFRKRHDGNWGVINFQTSSKTDRTQIVFTINLGVVSAAINEVIEPVAEPSDPPEIEDCHWETRIGFLLPEQDDNWWVLDRESDVDRLSETIRVVLRNVAVPAIVQALDDAALAELLERGADAASFLPEVDRLEYLTVLLKRVGDEQRLRRAVEELRATTEKLHAPPEEVDQHLARLARMSGGRWSAPNYDS